MTPKKTIIYISLAIYLLLVVMVTIYHANYFSDYVRKKGNETLGYTFYLMLSSVLFQGLVWVVTKSFNWKAALIGIVANYVLSFIVGMWILLATGLRGIPQGLIFIYGACYMTFFALVTIIQTVIRKD